MNNLTLYLTTRGRVDKQFTLKSLPDAWLARTVIVCPKSEARQMALNFPEVADIQTPKLDNLAEKRAWIFANARTSKIVMLDDDIQFVLRKKNLAEFKGYHARDPYDWATAKVRDPAVSQLYKPDTDDRQLDQVFKAIEKMLDRYAHGGISQRFMNHANGSEFLLNRKVRQALAWHVPTVRKYCGLNRIMIASEYDYSLQLMEAGYESAVYQWAALQEPRGYEASGGVSIYRTHYKNNLCKIELSKLHPGIVTVGEYTKADLQSPHIPFRISWAKAIKQGLTAHGRRPLVKS